MSLDPSEVATPSADLPQSVCPPKPRLPRERLERIWAWGMASSGMSYVYRPSTIEGIREAFAAARKNGVTIGMRGAGCSYGDASINSEAIVLDLSRMTRILEWNPETGVIKVEPGVTLRQVWQYAIEDGWWPYVVTGTMYPTIGGMASMNVHGKNNFKVGPIGDHIREFELLLPSGEIVACNREQNADLFHAAIGGFGMLGCFTSITLELKRIHSGWLRVEPISVGSLEAMISVFEKRKAAADYLVGWLDCFATGQHLGRGLIHQADYLPEGEDPAPAQSLRVVSQELPDTMLGFFPKGIMWRLTKPLVNNLGVRLVNAAKYHSARLLHNHHKHLQTHAEFAFLLDYLPNWKWAYKPGGLIQYQSFVPAERAAEVFRAQIELQHRYGQVAYLGVFKRHRPDPFLMTHSVDGFSLALDFRVTRWNKNKLWQLAAEMDRLVIEAGGRFYFAKDSTLHSSRLESYLGEERVRKFLEIKRLCDPDNILQTDLYRRVFGAQ